jgi:Zn-dependent protease
MMPPRSRWSWRLGAIAGIPIRVHATFLLLVAWIAVAYAAAGATAVGVAFNVLLLLAVFATIVVHELGHAMMARQFGGITREITLLPIGGIASMDRIPDRPRHELAVALVGPAINLAIGFVLAAVIAAAGWETAVEPTTSLGHAFVVQLMWINFALALFNLLPAFPLDGGRALRALLAMRGSRLHATETAGRIGMVLAVVLGAVGVLWNWWLLLIAAVVFFGAQSEVAMARFQAAQEPAPFVPPPPVTGPMQFVTGDNVVVVVTATPPMPQRHQPR